MATPAKEISEGYPTSGQVFEPPQQSRENEQPRFITILGSFIEPTTARERSWTRFGGIEASSPCLRYVRNFICKGRITPLLRDTYPWMSADIWEKATQKDASYFPRPVPAGYIPPADPYGNPSKVPVLVGKLAYPGMQIETIVNGSANVLDRSRRGIVELQSLRGMEFNIQTFSDNGSTLTTDPELWKIQRTIFPDFPKLPVLVSETRKLLDDASVHTYLRATVDEMQTSLDQFEDFAMATVEQTHYTMRESAAKSNAGYIPRYTDLDFVLLEQLGMARQDREIRQDAKAPTGKMEELFSQFLQLQIEEKQRNAEREQRLSSTTTPQVLYDPAVIQSPPEAKSEFYTCEHCGEEVKVRGKSFHIGKWCKVLHPKTVEDASASDNVNGDPIND